MQIKCFLLKSQGSEKKTSPTRDHKTHLESPCLESAKTASQPARSPPCYFSSQEKRGDKRTNPRVRGAAAKKDLRKEFGASSIDNSAEQLKSAVIEAHPHGDDIRF